MKSILTPFLDAIKHLGLIRNLLSYFDAQERRLVFQSLVIGVVVWAIVFALKNAVHWVFETMLHWVEHSPSLLLVFVPLLLGAAIMAAFATYKNHTVHYRDNDGHIHELIDVEGDGLERAISLYYASKPTLEQSLLGKEGIDVRWEMPTFSLAARKFMATLITLGSGGSGGLEASVALIGESTAAGLFKPRQVKQGSPLQNKAFNRLWSWWRPAVSEDLQTAQLAGIAAAVTTLLGAPFAGAFFAAEVMYRRRPIIEKLIYSLIAALVAFFLNNIFSGGHSVIFEIEHLPTPPNSWAYYGVLVLTVAIISLISIYFSRLRTSFDEGFHRRQPRIWQRHLTGAAVTGAIALLATYFTGHGLDLVLGPGEGPILDAFAGELTITVALIALIAKLFATLATISAGGSAGLLVPSIFFGTMVATIMAQLFGYPSGMLIVPAMAASLVSLVNVPLAAIMFTVEVFGAAYMAPVLVTLVVTTILAHDNNIYRTQREADEQRQILPGFSIRRVTISPAWAGKTIIQLQIRQKYEVNVIGLVEVEQQDGPEQPQTRLNPNLSTPLTQGNILIVLGEDDKLDTFEVAMWAENI